MLSDDPTTLVCRSPQRSIQKSPGHSPLSASLQTCQDTSAEQDQTDTPTYADTLDTNHIMPERSRRLSIASRRHQTKDHSSQHNEHRHRSSNQNARVTSDPSLLEYTLNRNVSTVFDL